MGQDEIDLQDIDLEEIEGQMLLDWAQILRSEDLDKDVPLQDSLTRLSNKYEGCAPLLQSINSQLESGESLRQALSGHQYYFRLSSVFLPSVGESLGEYTENRIGCIADMLEKGSELVTFQKKHSDDEVLMNEILLCYSAGILVNAGALPISAWSHLTKLSKDFSSEPISEVTTYIVGEISDLKSAYEMMDAANGDVHAFSPSTLYLATLQKTGLYGDGMLKAAEMLQLKEQYGLAEEKVQEMVFYYTLGHLLKKEASVHKVVAGLEIPTYEIEFFPGIEIFKEIIKTVDPKASGLDLYQALSLHENQFSPSTIAPLQGANGGLAQRVLGVAQSLQQKYCSLIPAGIDS